MATTEGGDCELGGSTTILQHTPGHSPLRIIDRGQMSSSAVCHTHPSKKTRSINAFSSPDDISRKNSTKSSPQTIRPKSAAGGAGNISATTAVAVVAAKATTALVCSRDPTNKSDVEL